MGGKKILYLTKVEDKIFGAIIDCCINTAVGKDRICNLYKKVINHFAEKKEKINPSMVHCLIKLLVTVGILKKAFVKPLPGKKRAVSTYEIVREIFDNIDIKTVKKRTSQMREEMGLPLTASENKKIVHEEMVPKQDEVDADDEFIERVEKVLANKQEEFDDLQRKADIAKAEMVEIAKNLEIYKVSRIFLNKKL